MSLAQPKEPAIFQASPLFLSGLLLLFTASLMLSVAAARSAEMGKTTPTLLRLQKELVETLKTEMDEMTKEAHVGQRNVQERIYVAEAYFNALAEQRVMDARMNKRVISDQELSKIQLAPRSEALTYFQEFSREQEMRHDVGEISPSDVASAKAAALRAEVALEALKSSIPR